MMRTRSLLAVLLSIPLTSVVVPTSAQAQLPAAVPDRALSVQTGVAGMSAATLDSACAVRAIPRTAASILSALGGTLAVTRIGRRPPRVSTPGAATMRASTITLGWYGVLLLIGISVLVVAGSSLRQVTDALERDTLGALLTGLVADLASIPILVIVVIALAATILGILLIPFAVVALMLVYAGLALMGFLAVATVTGRAIVGSRRTTMSERGAGLAALIAGLSVFLAVWLIAALFTWSPLAGLLLRSIAVGVTAVAVTAGVGAVIRSRRAPAEALVEPTGEHPLAWQTPTPVGGVVAARRS